MVGSMTDESRILDSRTFVDDVGNLIEIETLPETIVSLSSMHTENLYFLGKGNLITGVDTRSNFPYEVVPKVHYDLRNDYQLEQLIASDPDLILITPDMNTHATHVVSVLETSCRWVVSLAPEDLSEFDAYITKLGMLTGAEAQVEEVLEVYHDELDRIQGQVATMVAQGTVEKRPLVFVEAAERGYETFYEGSPIDEALALVQADHLPEKNRQPYDGAETLPYGFKKLIENGEDIDHYFTLQGRPGDGTSPIIIRQKKEMHQIRGIREDNLHELLVPLIDNYTLRYPIGVEGLARQIYGEAYDQVTAQAVDLEQVMTRSLMANILYDHFQLEPFTVIDSNYYDFEKFHHTFGSFLDVSWQDKDFHQIEAVVMMAYLFPIKKVDGITGDMTERFGRDEAVTRSEIAKFINTVVDLAPVSNHVIQEDISDHPDAKVIQKVVEAGWMTVDADRFRPDETITVGEFLSLLEQLN